MSMLLLAAVLSAAPAVELTAEAPPIPSTQLFFSSVPQLGLLGVDAQVGLAPRFEVDLGGWNAFKTDQGAFLRGGYLGGRFTVLHTDALDIRAGLRVFGAQPTLDASAVAGVSGLVESRIKVASFFSIHPDFDLTWLGSLTSARFTNEFAFTFGEWKLGASAGVQLWVIDSVAQAAPAVGLSLGWRHDFGKAALELGGQLGLTRDPSYLTQVAVLRAPRDEMGVWAGVRAGVVFSEFNARSR